MSSRLYTHTYLEPLLYLPTYTKKPSKITRIFHYFKENNYLRLCLMETNKKKEAIFLFTFPNIKWLFWEKIDALPKAIFKNWTSLNKILEINNKTQLFSHTSYTNIVVLHIVAQKFFINNWNEIVQKYFSNSFNSFNSYTNWILASDVNQNLAYSHDIF